MLQSLLSSPLFRTSLFKQSLGAIAIALPIITLPISTAIAQIEDLTFTLINDSSSTLQDFYLVPAGAETWEEDLLAGTLRPDEYVPIVIEDGLETCAYDIYGEFTDGSTIEDYGLDFCEIESYTLVD